FSTKKQSTNTRRKPCIHAGSLLDCICGLFLYNLCLAYLFHEYLLSLSFLGVYDGLDMACAAKQKKQNNQKTKKYTPRQCMTVSYRYLFVFALFFALTFIMEGFTNLLARLFFALFMMALISLLYPTKKNKRSKT